MLLSLVAAKVPHHMRKKACFTHHFNNELDIEDEITAIRLQKNQLLSSHFCAAVTCGCQSFPSHEKCFCFTHHFDNDLDIKADPNQIANNISHSGSNFEQNL
jgi:hypothetical protein